MRLRAFVCALLLASAGTLPGDAVHAAADDAGRALAARVASACGHDAWSGLERLSFTWHHHPSGTERRYVWSVPEAVVEVSMGDERFTVPVAGPSADDADGPDADALRDAHAAFVNDNYWMLFEQHLAWDGNVRFEDLGTVAVPQFDELGPRRALSVQYGSEGGYTPGDRYVLYLGDDDRPVAWAFHRSGAEQPSLVTLRDGWESFGGVWAPTRFTRADGSVFITIENVQAQ